MVDNKHITLKEAAALSGYSADYLGQLIRKGKLEGEQVFMNTAWMTTEIAVLDYVDKTKKSKTHEKKSFLKNVVQMVEKNWDVLSIYFLYAVIFLNVLFLVFLFFLFSVSVEKHFDKKDAAVLPTDKVILIDTI